MDREPDLSTLDPVEPAWGDEDAAQRAAPLWLARARAFAARSEPHEDVPAEAVTTMEGEAAPESVSDALADFVAALHGTPKREEAPAAVSVEEPRDQEHPIDEDTSWFTPPEPAPGTLELVAPPPVPQPGFPPAWFPAPEPEGESSPSVGDASAASAALARFEAGLPRSEETSSSAPPDAAPEPPHDVHAWFASSQAFLDTLQAEAAAVSGPTPDEASPVATAVIVAEPEPVQEMEAAPVPATPFASVEPTRPAEPGSTWLEHAVADADTPFAETVGAQPEPPIELAERAVAAPALVPDVSCVADEPNASADGGPVVQTGDAPTATVTGRTIAVGAAAPVRRASPAVTAAAPTSAPRNRGGRFTRGRVAALAVASLGGLAVVATMLVPSTRTSSPPAAVARPPLPDASASPAIAPARVAPSAPTGHPAAVHQPPSAPAWHETREWTGARKKSLAFELAAERPVRLWMRQVTPVLVMRCLGGTLDAFVVTQSPSALEPGRADHTVRLSFDDGAEIVERWTDSAEHDGLFAPDGRATLARAARAGRLRFTFTPHNAPAAEASFRLAGLETLQSPLTKFCR